MRGDAAYLFRSRRCLHNAPSPATIGPTFPHNDLSLASDQRPVHTLLVSGPPQTLRLPEALAASRSNQGLPVGSMSLGLLREMVQSVPSQVAGGRSGRWDCAPRMHFEPGGRRDVLQTERPSGWTSRSSLRIR